jgi:hypothetical protein
MSELCIQLKALIRCLNVTIFLCTVVTKHEDTLNYQRRETTLCRLDKLKLWKCISQAQALTIRLRPACPTKAHIGNALELHLRGFRFARFSIQVMTPPTSSSAERAHGISLEKTRKFHTCPNSISQRIPAEQNLIIRNSARDFPRPEIQLTILEGKEGIRS